jgi:ribosomal protein L22
VEKVLRSAVANAESRPDLHWNGDDLVVVTAYADEGRTLKALPPPSARPRPRSSSGRATSLWSSR